MKRKLTLFWVAAALIGGIALSTPTFAGTLTVKGDTEVNMYGFVRAQYSWNTQMTGEPDYSNMPKPDATGQSSPSYKSTYNKTYAASNVLWTRLGVSFKNEDANLNGGIEGDFVHGSDFRMRKAYITHKIGKVNILIGQNYIVEVVNQSISAVNDTPVGFNNKIKRVPQVQIRTKFDMGSAELDVAAALEYGAKEAVKRGTNSKFSQTMYVDRVAVPYPAVNLTLHFDTGFGSPSKIYVYGSAIPVYMTTSDKTSVVDKSETSYAFGAGFKIPVSRATIAVNYIYTNGAEGYSGATDFAPASYYYTRGDIKKTTSNAFNINAVVPLVKNLKIGTEYDFAEFKNDDAFNAAEPKVYTYLGKIDIKTTKYTKLTLEYRYVEAKNFDVIKGVNDDKFDGNQIFAIYKYVF